MDISETCHAFNNDAAYIHALTGDDEKEIEKAWVCLYKTHRGYKNAVLLRLGLDSTEENSKDTEDAYEESIIAVVTAIRNGKFIPGKAKISTYLFSCCRNQVLVIKRRQARFSNNNYTDEQKEQMQDEINLQVTQETEEEYTKKVGIIKQAVAELRKSCADILYRVLYGSQDLAFIAGDKEISFHYAEIEFSRCKKKLAELLVSKYKFPPDGIWL